MNCCISTGRALSSVKPFSCRQGPTPAIPECRKPSVLVFAVSDATGPILKKPELKRPERKADEPEPRKLFADAQSDPSTSSTAPLEVATGVTVEYQRQKAKEMTRYFDSLKFEEKAGSSKVFGWTPENEVGNGRWVMMGIAIGLLTEYATGVDFVDQLKMMVSYLGIADIE